MFTRRLTAVIYTIQIRTLGARPALRIARTLCSRQYRAHLPPSTWPRPPLHLAVGVFGFLWGGHDENDKVPASVKQQLLKAQRALREGKYEDAGKAYHNALKRLGSSEHASAQAYVEARAVVLDKLANMYLEQGLLEKAEVTFKEAMRFMLTAGMEQESEAIVEISLKISKIYTNKKNYELAEAGFDWCVKTSEKICTTSRTKNNLALWGMCLHNKGQYHLSVEEWERAVLCLEKALKLSKEVFDCSHLQVAVLHNDLATALDGNGRYSEAEEHARASLDIMSDFQATDTDVDIEYFARVYYNLGMILTHQGKTAEAKVVLAKALDKSSQLEDKSFQVHIEHILKNY